MSCFDRVMNFYSCFINKMLIQGLLIFLATKVVQSREVKSTNVTTLLPTNKTQHTATSWKIETAFAPTNLDKSQENGGGKEKSVETEDNSGEKKIEIKSAELKEDNGNITEFKPSPQLESYVDVGSFEGPTKDTLGFSPVIKKPPAGFYGSPKSKYPKDIFKNYHQFPYKIENPILTRTKDSWTPSSSGVMEPTPTDEAPVRIPAGGFYKLPDAFKEKPGLNSDDPDFGLDFGGSRETGLKRRSNPWKQLMNFIIASIPVGIIISALTPNVLTIQSTGPEYNGHHLRRSDLLPPISLSPDSLPPIRVSPDTLPPISERCRRRLLCELHSDVYYRSSRHPKQCYRIPCEDKEGLSRALNWILSQRHNGDYRNNYT